MDLISDITETLMPILSVEELHTISLRYLNEQSTHPHLLGRSKLFQSLTRDLPIRMMDEETTYSSKVRQILTSRFDSLDETVLGNAYKSDLNRIYPNLMQEGVKYPEDMLDNLRKIGYVDSPVAACPFGECILLSRDKSYIELGLSMGRLVYANYYVRVFSKFNKDWDRNWEDSTEASLNRHAKNIAALILILSSVSEGDIKMNDLDLEGFFDRFYDCGFASYERITSGGRVIVSTYDNDKSIFLNFVSN